MTPRQPHSSLSQASSAAVAVVPKHNIGRCQHTTACHVITHRFHIFRRAWFRPFHRTTLAQMPTHKHTTPITTKHSKKHSKPTWHDHWPSPLPWLCVSDSLDTRAAHRRRHRRRPRVCLFCALSSLVWVVFSRLSLSGAVLLLVVCQLFYLIYLEIIFFFTYFYFFNKSF